MKEPETHSFISGTLPEGHPSQFLSVFCIVCKAMVHAFNNECMRPWVEAENGNFCWDCITEKKCLIYLGD